MKKIASLLISFLALGHFANAQINAPKYSNEFLSIGASARGLAMSGTQVSSVDDVSSGYWNPAGLVNMAGKHQFGLMHNSYFAGIANYNFAGAATFLDSNSVLSLNFIRFSIDDIPDTRNLFQNGQLNYERIQRFSAADNAAFISYARKNVLVKGLNIGGSAKIIFRNAGQFANAWGFGLDVGAQYSYKNWRFGALLRDIGTFAAWQFNTTQIADAFAQTGNTIPENSIELTLPRLITGFSYYFPVANGKFGIMPALDLDITTDGERNVPIKTSVVSIDPRFGIETNYKKMIFLRGGLGNIQQIKTMDGTGTTNSFQPNVGVGILIKGFQIDYALTDVGNQSEALYSNVFSLRINLK